MHVVCSCFVVFSLFYFPKLCLHFINFLYFFFLLLSFFRVFLFSSFPVLSFVFSHVHFFYVVKVVVVTMARQGVECSSSELSTHEIDGYYLANYRLVRPVMETLVTVAVMLMVFLIGSADFFFFFFGGGDGVGSY